MTNTPEKKELLAACPSCGGLNTSCPDGCGRDPVTGELNGTRLDTPEKEELLPCPFCGGDADFGTRPNERAWWSLHCSECTAYRCGPTKAEAIAAWNTRTPRLGETGDDDVVGVLLDPIAVHVNMLAGRIAKPSAAAIWHIYREELLTAVPDDMRAALSAIRQVDVGGEGVG